MARRKIDPRAIRDSLARLDEIAKKHPELIAQDGEESSPEAWESTLQEVFSMSARPKEIEDSVIVNLRLPATMIGKIEEVGEKLKAQGLGMGRSGIIRYLIEQGLKAQEEK